jgi:hypothetical protein
LLVLEFLLEGAREIEVHFGLCFVLSWVAHSPRCLDGRDVLNGLLGLLERAFSAN